MSLTGKKAWIGRCLLLTASLVGSVGFGELMIRAWLQRTQSSSQAGWRAFSDGAAIAPRSRHALAAITRVSANRRVIYELRPGISTNFGGFTLAINGLGARATREYPVARLPISVRIIGIGDSGMFGWDVDQGGDYLAVLERNLNAASNGITYEVINLAVPGYNTRQELERLKDAGLALKPDIVVVGWCVNDFGLPFFTYRARNHWRTRACYVYRILFDRPGFDELAAPEVVKGRELEEAMIPKEILSERGPEGMAKTLAELRALADTHGFRVLVFGPLHKDIRELCRDAGLACFNTLEEMPPGRYPKRFRVHDMHPKPEGHQVLAENLQRALEDHGWLTPSVIPPSAAPGSAPGSASRP